MRRSLVFRILICAALVCSVVMIAPTAAVGTTDGFHWVNPKPNGERLESVDMLDANIGYAVGDYGTIMKTYDGGANWIEKNSGTNDPFFAVSMADSDTGWAAGDWGGIYKTDGTGGATWWKQYTITGGTRRVNDIFCFDASHVWAVTHDGKVIRTVDGGVSWTDYDAGDMDWRGVYFTSATTGWIVSFGGDQWKTTDGGANWTMQDVLPGGLVDITFTDANHGWIVNKTGTIWRTTDGGATGWTPSTDPLCPQSATSVNFSTNQIGWMTTNGASTLYKSIDGGATWQPADGGLPMLGLNCVATGGTSAAIAVGDGGAITRTSNGTAWTPLPRQFVNGDGLADFQFFGLRTGYAVGSDVYKTTNAGLTWSRCNVPFGALFNMYFRNATTGWAVGMNGLIHKTTDGGATWTRQGEGETTQNILDVYFADDNVGWAVGDGGLIMRTFDGGDHWAASSIGSLMLTCVDFSDADNGAIVGGNGTVYTTTDGGDSWMLSPSAGTEQLTCLDYVAPGVLYVGTRITSTGPLGTFTVLKSTDGGSSWTVVNGGNLTAFLEHGTPYDMHFTSASDGWILFESGIAKTSDGGATWSYERLTSANLIGMAVVDGTWVWAGGSNDALLSNYTPAMKTVWRFYNKKTGTHLYTADPDEKASIKANLSSIYEYEGVCYVYDEYKAEATLVRFYRPSTNTHFYSADPDEINKVRTTMANIYTYEGPVYNVSYRAGNPVWRFYNKKTGTHFYTADPAERDSVRTNLSGTYDYEDAAYYLPQL